MGTEQVPLHKIDDVTNDFLKRTREVSVNRWDAPYGGDQTFMAEKGEGDFLIGPDGEGYLDWNNGILCKIFGYRDPEMERLIMDQVRSGVIHTSSVYLNKATVEFKEAAAESLKKWGDFKILPTSSGTIADNMAIRFALARIASQDKGTNTRYIIPLAGYSGADGFSNPRCGLADWKGNSTPKVEGIQFIAPSFEDSAPFKQEMCVAPNRVDAWFDTNCTKAGATPITLAEAGTLGVGGFRRMTSEWMREITRATKQRGGVFACDCVQSFPGRTNEEHLWGFERWVQKPEDVPDIITTAKGLGDGLPIGLVAVKKEIADCVDGKWFDTFAANPLAARVATEVLRRMGDPALRNNMKDRAKDLRDGLETIYQYHVDKVRAVVGSGLMSGLAIRTPEKIMAIRNEAQKRGLLLALGTDGTLRIAPHYDTTSENIKLGLNALEDTIKAVG